MTGRPRKKKDETLRNFRGRMKEWYAEQVIRLKNDYSALVEYDSKDQRVLLKMLALDPAETPAEAPTEADEHEAMVETAKEFNKSKKACNRCELWREELLRRGFGQCYRYPKETVTVGTHWCQEFLNNNKHILGDS